MLNDLNEYAISGDLSVIIQDLNNLLFDKEKNMDLIFLIICSCQLFGFVEYENLDLSYFEDRNRLELLMGSYSGKQFKYLNSGQLSLLDEFYKYEKILLSAPTSFGKTSIVNEYIINNYNYLNNIIYVIPTNSLIEELYHKFLKLNVLFNLNYKVSTIPKIDCSRKNILLLTPERFLLLNTIYNLDIFDLIIMDEMYKIVNSRNQSATDVVNGRSSRFRKTLELICSSKVKNIFLSPYTYVLSPSMRLFVEKYGIQVINRKIDYVNHNIYNLHSQQDFKKHFNLSQSDYCSDDTISNKVTKILKQLVGKQNIVYISALSTAEKIVDLADSSISMLNRTERFEIFYNHLCKNYTVDNLEVWKVIKGLEKGIGIYTSPIPRYIKKEIVSLYNDFVISTLIVTTSFVEGVNTNAENIIITSKFTAQSIPLEEIDLLNIMGRAGRFGKSSVGNIYAINNDIYRCLIGTKSNDIVLCNPNYELSDSDRDDYEIDMINDEYLNENESKNKRETLQMQTNLGLSDNELHIALNIPKKWKLVLYQFFVNEPLDNLSNYYMYITNIFSDNKLDVEESILNIFSVLWNAFYQKIDIFKTSHGDIRPFTLDGNFIWGMLYKTHSYASLKDILYYKKKNIEKKLEDVLLYSNLPETKNELKAKIRQSDMYLLNFLKADLSIDDSKIYNDTFKFISDVMQYKIPFYINFFASVFKLYLTKNDVINLDPNAINPEELAMFFENGNVKTLDRDMLDYGIPNELLILLNEHNVIINASLNINELDFIDNYQKIILNEFQSIFF